MNRLFTRHPPLGILFKRRIASSGLKRESDKHADELQQTFMRKAQKYNADSTAKAKTIRAKNRILGSFLALSIIGIYTYTLCTVKQEKFLDEIIEPESNKS